LCDPNPNSPANGEAAKLYSEDRKEYIRRVRNKISIMWNFFRLKKLLNSVGVNDKIQFIGVK